MPIISFASPKGGCGKTTSAVLLCCDLARRGYRTLLLDADPLGWSVKWSQKDGLPANLEVKASAGEASVATEALDAHEQYDFVVIDTEGTGNLGTANAVGASDLVIVPVQGSVMDAEAGLLTLKMVYSEGRKARRAIPAVVMMTRASAAIASRNTKAVAENYREQGISFLDTAIVERAAYKSMFDFGGDFVDLPRADMGSNPQGAIDNADQFGAEILETLRSLNVEIRQSLGQVNPPRKERVVYEGAAE